MSSQMTAESKAEDEPAAGGQRLVDSFRTTPNCTGLRGLLAQHEIAKAKVAAMDKEIERALLVAADEGKSEACRLLFNGLSVHRQERYVSKDTWQQDEDEESFAPPLHVAVRKRHFAVTNVLLNDCKFNANQLYSPHGRDETETPLSLAISSQEMTLLLLGNGADPNLSYTTLGWHCNRPLNEAIEKGYEQVVRLLLEHGADASLTRKNATEDEEEIVLKEQLPTDAAILNGRGEILDMLLQEDVSAGLSGFRRGYGYHATIVNDLLESTSQSLENKLSVCRVLVANSYKARSGEYLFMEASMVGAIRSCILRNSETDCFQVLLDAGMDPAWAKFQAVVGFSSNKSACKVLMQHGVDPFREERMDIPYFDVHETISMYQLAAREDETDILEFFLDHWDERFSGSGGKNADGDYPIHVACADRKVSLEAVKLLVQRQGPTVSTVGGKRGLFPFHLAAMEDASLSVIHCLLRHCPDSLDRLRDDRPTTKNVEDPPSSKRKVDNEAPPGGRDRLEDGGDGPSKKKIKSSM